MVRKRVLVAENGNQVGNALGSALEALGYSVSSAAYSDRGAMRNALEEEPDVVLVDIDPDDESSGIAAAAEIRSDTHIPVVFSLTQGVEKRLARSGSIPPFSYVFKPCQARELHIVIETALHVAQLYANRNQTEETIRDNGSESGSAQRPMPSVEQSGRSDGEFPKQEDRVRSHRVGGKGNGNSQKLAIRLLQLLNRAKGEQDVIRNILVAIKEFTGMEAVGIRLEQGGDFPYYQVLGFPGDFVEAEKSLCIHDESGGIVRDHWDDPILACICGDVIKGRTDPALPFFTENGSFWTSGSSKLFTPQMKESLKGHYRYRCMGEGYESLVLIPLRSGKDVIGVLQMNDRRENMFTRDMIGFFEGIGDAIGIAFENIRAARALRESEEHLRFLVNSSKDGIISVDLDRRVTSCNPAFLEQFGYSREEVIGKSIQLVHLSSEHFERFGEVCYSTVEREGSWRGEWEYRRKDGSALPMETVVSELRLPERDRLGYVAVMRDISDRKRATEVLRQKEYLDALHETSLGLVKRLTVGDLLEAIVARACALLGCYQGYIHLYDPETGDLEIKASSGPLKSSIGYKIKPGQGLVGKVFLTGSPLTVNNYSTWKGRLQDSRFDPVRAAVGVPLKSGARVHGVIGLVYSEEGRKFGQEEINVLSRFAELATITLENVELYSALERELEERKRAEAALMESEEKYRLLVENSGDIAYSLGPDFRHTYVSPVVERLTGYTAEEAAKQTLDEIFTSPSAEILREAYKRRIRDEKNGIRRDEVERWELEHKHKDGHTVWGEVSVKPLRDPEGRFAGLQGITRDITARKRAEWALRESEEKYRLVAQATSDIIFEFRFDGAKYAHISPNCEEILGYTAEELSSVPYFMRDFMALPEDLEEIKKGYTAALKGKDKQLTYEFRVRCKDGNIKYLLESSVFIRDARGKVTAMIGSYKDVTEKKRMEAQLRQVQKMEAIGTLAGGVAHDFNNILAAMMGYTELALFDLPAGQRARTNLQQVLKSGDRAKSLVQQILSFSRQTDQERKPLRLGPIVKEALKLLRPSLPSTIEIRSHVEMSSAIVPADPTQIHQVIMNLCTNAAHAMRQGGGVLEIGLDRVDLDEGSARQFAELVPGRYQRLSVSDTGHGMDQKTQDRIFDPFFTTKGAGEGTGMGLAVVHGIVKSHEGAITVYSEPGKGSTFRIYLPEIEVEAEDEPFSAVAPMPTGGEHILFVDDEASLVNVGRETMEHLGYRVTGVTSAVEALELFRKSPDNYDLVITDQTMPKMTGIRLATEMLKIRPGIPILLCTGFSHDTSAEKALACGIKRFLMKPLTARDVAQVIRDVLDNGGNA